MNCNFLKAGSGDSILIHHKGYNVLIDGGNESKYLLSQIDRIYNEGQKLDLLVITHHDDDHIRGIIDLLKHVTVNYQDIKFIERVIFNSPRLATGKLIFENDNLISYKQAYEVEQLLINLNLTWEIYSCISAPIDFDDLKLTFLSPTLDDIKEYSENKGAYLTGDHKCDWQTSMSVLDKYIDDKSQDQSLFNRASIVIKLECEGKNILLTGDVTPDRLESIILSLAKDKNSVEFDYMKLPHHGSYRSLNRSILQNIKCDKFIVTTNSKRHFLPNKRALLKVLKYIKREKNGTINFFFNYSEALANLGITAKELKDYNFALFANNNPDGFNI